MDIKGMRKTHFDQLLMYIMERDNTEWYYGNKKQFEKGVKDVRQE